MTNLNNGVDIQGMGNTIDLNKVMNLYTSSFTEGFLQVLENYKTPSQEIEVVQKKVKTLTVPKSKPKNKGFEKLKNPLLREKLEKGKSVVFDPKTHVRVKDLNVTSIYVLDARSRKLWKQYFSKGNVYIDKNITPTRLSKRVLFDKSILELFSKKDDSK